MNRQEYAVRRAVVMIALLGVAWCLLESLALAADWPKFGLPPNPKDFDQARGPGHYFSVIKLTLFVVLFLVWVKTTDWVNQDCQHLRLNYGLWNSVVFGVFFGCVLLFWVLPWFLVGYLLLLLGYATPLAFYILERNKHVDDDHKVMTGPFFRRVFASVGGKVGLKIDAEKKAAHELGPDVKFTAQGGVTDQADQANMIMARQNPGFVFAKELFAQAEKMRAEQISLDYTAAGVAVKYQIDGMWHNHNPLEREKGDPVLEVFKTLAGLKPADRVSKQSGGFGAEIGGKKFSCKLQSQGTSTGELAVVSLEQKRLPFTTFDELGMRTKMQEQLRDLVGQKSGFFLVSSLPGGGLTTTFDVLMASTDRFMRNFVAIEDEVRHEREIENILVTRYDSRQGQTPMDVLPKLIRTYPDVYVIRDFVNGETVDTLCEQVTVEERMLFSTLRAKEGVEALLRVLMLKPAPDREAFANAITAVLNVRLVRKLCEHCKEAYAPPPEVLKQLGLPAGKIQALYRPPVPPPPESEAAKQFKPCEVCMQIGYLGRTAIFELTVVNDAMREILRTQPKLELLREASRKASNRNLQEEGVLLLARGITSVPELVRVLKQ